MVAQVTRFSLGALVGLALWVLLGPAYHAALVRLFHGERMTLPVDQLTYNVILLFGLFAMNRHPFRDRNIARFGLSFLIVIAFHFVAVFLLIEALNTGNLFWTFLSYGYRLVGMFAIPFACWYSPQSTQRSQRKESL